jgi:hypothetical protein
MIQNPTHAQMSEVVSLLLAFLAATNGAESVPLIRTMLTLLNKLPGALPVIVRTLELMAKAKDKLSQGNWKRAFEVAVSDYTAVKLADSWLKLVPLVFPGGRPKVLSHEDWNLLRERARG